MTTDMLSWLRQQVGARKALAESASPGPWTSGEAVIRFPDDSTAKIFIEEIRFEKNCYAELICRGWGDPPAVLDAP